MIATMTFRNKEQRDLRHETKYLSKKLLIVDQDYVRFSRFHPLAEKLDCTIEGAMSGREALLSIFFDKPSVIFLNPVFHNSLQMQTLENIKKSAPDIPVILMLDAKYKTEALADPRLKLANGFLTKPLASMILDNMIKKIIELLETKSSHISTKI